MGCYRTRGKDETFRLALGKRRVASERLRRRKAGARGVVRCPHSNGKTEVLLWRGWESRRKQCPCRCPGSEAAASAAEEASSPGKREEGNLFTSPRAREREPASCAEEAVILIPVEQSSSQDGNVHLFSYQMFVFNTDRCASFRVVLFTWPAERVLLQYVFDANNL